MPYNLKNLTLLLLILSVIGLTAFSQVTGKPDSIQSTRLFRPHIDSTDTIIENRLVELALKSPVYKVSEHQIKINELDLDGVEPLLHMSNARLSLRNDEVRGSISREQALKNAPLHDDLFFKVPKVIRK